MKPHVIVMVITIITRNMQMHPIGQKKLVTSGLALEGMISLDSGFRGRVWTFKRFQSPLKDPPPGTSWKNKTRWEPPKPLNP